jgi:adenylosuccinate lyase
MIHRYTRPEMGQIWEPKARFQKMLDVEIAVAEAQGSLKMIPAKAVQAIRTKSRFEIDKIAEIEKQTKHDVIAFVTNVASHVGEYGRYVHFGMTSSDVLDTASSLQIGEAGDLILKGVQTLKKVMQKLILKNEKTMCAGRTHGMFAEPTTFGFKMAGFYSELLRNEVRVKRAIHQARVAKLSGAVGTYSAQSMAVEAYVAKKLKLKVEPLATQVVPRDRHAEVLWSLAVLGAGIERLSIELRHLQRSEVGEVVEGFTPGQKGSSAMPHKKNPISAENLTGLSRMLRGYADMSMENIALWHERDISHSSVERVIFPDAFILADYAIHRMASLLEGLFVNQERMIENIEKSQGMLFSSHALLMLVDKGWSREDAYAKVQSLSHHLQKGESLKHKILTDKELVGVVKKQEVEDLFSGKKHQKNISKVIQRVLKGEQL